MLSKKENQILTRVGPGTPAGELLRRYWHPVAVAAELNDKPIKRVRILGEDLVLYRGDAGVYGLVAEHCPHRGASQVGLQLAATDGELGGSDPQPLPP